MNGQQDRGITQAERFPKALAPDSIVLDERSFTVLMAMAPHYAQMLNFYNISDELAGNWLPFFESDPAFILAEICAWRPQTEAKLFRRPHELSLTDIDWTLLKQVFEMAHEIDQWYQRFGAQELALLKPVANPFFGILGAIIAKELKHDVAAIIGILTYLRAWDCLTGATARAAKFAMIWELPDLSAACAGHAGLGLGANGASNSSSQSQTKPNLSSIKMKFENAILRLKEAAKDYLILVMQRHDHLPQATLYMTFLKLFRLAQLDMNLFTERHLEYYYRTVLRLLPSDGTADCAVVVVELASTSLQYQLPAGTQMTAGSDPVGNKILFANTDSVWINQAKIQFLCALYQGNDFIYAAPVANSQNGLGAPLNDPAQGWATFGPSSADSGAEAQALNANLGFVIASSVLLLQEGVRTITLVFNFTDVATAQAQTQRYLALADPSLTELPKCTVKIAQLLSNAFLLFVSGEAGWNPIADFSLAYDSGSEGAVFSWTLTCNLALDAAALVANKSLYPGIATDRPMLKLMLNPNAIIYPYPYLNALTLASLQVTVSVQGLQNLSVETLAGPAAAGKPFSPFGSVPVTGASFQVASEELSVKNVTSAQLNLTWLTLPPGGFAAYYAGYPADCFNNNIFTVNLAVYSGGKWVPQTDDTTIQPPVPQAYKLFAEDAKGQLSSATQFNFDMAGKLVSYRANAAASAGTSATPLSGTLSVTLAAPAYAFGNAMYPTVFAQWAVANVATIGTAAAVAAATAVAAMPVTTTAKAKASSSSVATDVPTKATTKTVIEETVNTTTVSSAVLGQSGAASTTAKSGATADSSTAASLSTAADPGAPTTSGNGVAPNPPFAPVINVITLDYCASETIDPVPLDDKTNAMALKGLPFQFYHISPFGYALPAQAPLTLFPLVAGKGQFFIGFSNLLPPQSLNLYFEFFENSASQFSVLSPAAAAGNSSNQPQIEWRYLSSNQWKCFAADSVVSKTNNLTASGMTVFQMPADMNADNTLMADISASGAFWLTAYTNLDPGAYNKTAAILPQAIQTYRVDPGNTEILPLPAGSIVALSQPVAQVKSITQPYDSYGGCAKERLFQYQARVCERLKHKQRAILPSDFEQLVLAAFPAVWQAKCIGPNNSQNYPANARVAAGHVVLALSPMIGESPQDGPPLPMTTLELAACHLQALASPFIRRITVRNLAYEYLKVHVGVVFKSDQDASVYLSQLNELICQFLSPWQSQVQPYLDIGTGEVHVAEIAHLIMSQPYVEKISEVLVTQKYLARNKSLSGDDYRLEIANESGTLRSKTPWSVLVSVAQHAIVSSGSGGPPKPDAGVGGLIVGSDFIIGETQSPDDSSTLGALQPAAEQETVYVLTIPKSW